MYSGIVLLPHPASTVVSFHILRQDRNAARVRAAGHYAAIQPSGRDKANQRAPSGPTVIPTEQY